MSAGRLERRATALAAAFALACVAASAAGCSSPDGGGGDGSGPGGSRGSEQRSTPQQGQSGGGDAGGAGQSVKRPDPPKAKKEPPAEFSQDGFRVPSKQEGKLTDVRVGTGTAGGGGSDSGESSGGESSGSNDGSGGEQDGQSKPVETVTFDLGTGKLPEYHVRYVDAVRAHPAEQPIDVAGNAYLEVGFELTDPNKKGQLAIPPNTRPGQPLVKQTLLVRNVGGEVRFAIGLAEKVKFRARQEGGSLVIELRTG